VSFRGIHGGKVSISMFIEISVRACLDICVVLCNCKKKLGMSLLRMR
jgi:hypothetical protein